MSRARFQNLLAIGIDTVSVASSAKLAGYEIYAADYFGDIDLRRFCSNFRSLIKQKTGRSSGRFKSRFKPEAFLEMTRLLLKEASLDSFLLSSGLDDYCNVLNELNELVPIVGNHPRVIERVRDKPRFFEELKRLRIPHPETAFTRDVNEAKRAATEIGYPIVVKPSKGFGGANIQMARKQKDLERAFKIVSSGEDNVLIQEFIDGIHASASLLASRVATRTLTINEQLVGLPHMFQQEPFGYCGNVVPLDLTESILEKCKNTVEKIASRFGLIGSNGIDFVVSKENTPYVMEVNPRFQATLPCVERVVGINMVEAHINASVHNSLPQISEKSSAACTRLILHTPTRIITPDLTGLPNVMNVPLPGVIIEQGEPLCSVIIDGNSEQSSLLKAEREASEIYKMLCSA